MARAGAPGAAASRRTSSGSSARMVKALRLRRGVATVAAAGRSHCCTGSGRRCRPGRPSAPPSEPAPQQALTPSQPRRTRRPSSPTGAAAADRFQRGLLVHRLLQLLPELAPERARRRRPIGCWPVSHRRLAPERRADACPERAGPPSEAGPRRRVRTRQPGGAADLRCGRRPGDRGPDRPAGGRPRTRCWSSTSRATACRRPRCMPARSPIFGSSPPTATLLTALYPGRRVRAACSGPRRRASTRCRRNCSTVMRRQA